MTHPLGLEPGVVRLVEYDPRWPAKRTQAARFPLDREAYINAKSAHVHEVLALAGGAAPQARETAEPARLVTLTIRRATQRDCGAWLRLRHALWPQASESEHRADIDRFFAGHAREPLAVLLAEDGAGSVL